MSKMDTQEVFLDMPPNYRAKPPAKLGRMAKAMLSIY